MMADVVAIALDYRVKTQVIVAVLHPRAVGNGDVIMRKLQVVAMVRAQPVTYRGWILLSEFLIGLFNVNLVVW